MLRRLRTEHELERARDMRAAGHAYGKIDRRSYSPSTRRVCSIRISSAMLVRDSRTSSANGAFGRHERQDSDGKRLVTAASR
jgi:hypothetical protein